MQPAQSRRRCAETRQLGEGDQLARFGQMRRDDTFDDEACELDRGKYR